MDVIRNHRSIRKYRPDPVPDELLHTLFEIAR
jgi:nitroreductase